jgi:Zn-dependent M28 family amino/carboxypeptidase
MKIKIFSFRLVLSTFAVLSISALAFAQTDTAKPSLDDEIKADLELGPCKNDERLAAVKNLFLKLGASETDITIEKFKDVQNVVLVKKGKTDETVVIGAHYDKVSAGCGIIDNWSGIVLLARMYKALKNTETQKTYIFAAFDREETGLEGSAAMVKAIPKEKRASYCSMINLDSFGLGYPVVLENASSPKMVKLAKDMGAELKVTVTPITVPGANSDSSSFKNKDIPAITLSALSGKWPEFMHTSKDKRENTMAASVRVGYYFGLEFVNRVESSPCGIFK